jgi:hypothetical protein
MAQYAHPPEYKWTDHISLVVRTAGSSGAITPTVGLLEQGRRWWRRIRHPEA